MTDLNEGNYNIEDKPSWKAIEECWKYRRYYAIACAISILIAIFISLSIPKVYAAQVKVVDEQKETNLLIGLNSLTSSYLQQQIGVQSGIDNAEIYSMHLMSRSFAEEMANVEINGYRINYFQYLRQYHKEPWWTATINAIANIFAKKNEKDKIITIIQDNIKYKFESKSSIITIQFTDNNPVVAALMVDSIATHLQKFITNVKISKYRYDLINAIQIRKKTGEKYHETQRAYASFCDSHQEVSFGNDSIKKDVLQKERDDAFTVYSNACEQYIRALAYMNKRTIAFSMLKNATVPQTYIEPRLLVYIIVYTFITFIFVTWWILFKKTYIESNKK